MTSWAGNEKLSQEIWDSKFESHSEIPVLLWGKGVKDHP